MRDVVESKITCHCSTWYEDNIVFHKDDFWNERLDVLVTITNGDDSTQVRLDVDSMIKVRDFLNKTLEGL